MAKNTDNATVERMSNTITISINNLEMTSLEQFTPSQRSVPDFEVKQAKIASPQFSRFLYASVGDRWKWYERLSWSREKWMAYIDRPEHETWIGYLQGTPAGFFELEHQAGGNTEIVYFGLMPDLIGQGLGGIFLSAAVQRAWDSGARRVWVHTCTLDHATALDNYIARGFQVFKIEHKDIVLCTRPAFDTDPLASPVANA